MGPIHLCVGECSPPGRGSASVSAQNTAENGHVCVDNMDNYAEEKIHRGYGRQGEEVIYKTANKERKYARKVCGGAILVRRAASGGLNLPPSVGCGKTKIGEATRGNVC